MAQKITLSVPDMLYERIKQWRDSFNLSQMFQEAMTEAIQKKEEFQKRFQEEYDLPDIIKRLKEEKIASERKFFNLGKSEGLKWAKTAHYEDLVHVLHLKDIFSLPKDTVLSGYFQTLFSDIGIKRYVAIGPCDHEKLFLEGWQKSIQQFWDHIKESLQ